MNATTLRGRAKNGHPFEIVSTRMDGEILSRRLLWLSFNGIKTISVPLKKDTPIGDFFVQLKNTNLISEKIRRRVFAI